MQASGSSKQTTGDTQLIQLAQDYLAQLQSSDDQQAEIILQEINQLNNNQLKLKENPEPSEQYTQKTVRSDQDLYYKVGKLTRELHDSMSGFVNGSRIRMMTNEDMPDARQRLQHVVDLTEQSAHTTITLIENSNPLLSQMQETAALLQKQLHSHKNNQSANSSRSNATQSDSAQGSNVSLYLNEEIDAFLQLVSSSSKNVTNALNEIMLAQDYQDLTGQVIQRVSTLVQEVENSLLTLLQSGIEKTVNEQSAAEQLEADAISEKPKEDQNNKGYGPAVPGVSKGDVLHSQEEVDDLLSSLGF